MFFVQIKDQFVVHKMLSYYNNPVFWFTIYASLFSSLFIQHFVKWNPLFIVIVNMLLWT